MDNWKTFNITSILDSWHVFFTLSKGSISCKTAECWIWRIQIDKTLYLMGMMRFWAVHASPHWHVLTILDDDRQEAVHVFLHTASYIELSSWLNNQTNFLTSQQFTRSTFLSCHFTLLLIRLIHLIFSMTQGIEFFPSHFKISIHLEGSFIKWK